MGEKRNFYVLCFVTLVAFGINLFFSKPLEQQDEERVAPKVEQVAETRSNNIEEKYYVLQNNYQQIVFSNIGGAIVEVNLSLNKKSKDVSQIYAIGLDKKISESSPNNALFPSHKALIVTDSGQTEVSPTKGDYTPLLRRDIIDNEGKTQFKVDPKNYAIQLEAESYTTYKVTEFTKDKIVFTGINNGKPVTKSYSFSKLDGDVPYTLNIDVQVDGKKKGLWLSSGIPEVELVSSSFTPTLKYQDLASSKSSVKTISLPKEEQTVTSIRSGWGVNSNGFFGLMLDPIAGKIKKLKAVKIDGDEAPSRLSLLQNHEAIDFAGYQLYYPLQKGDAISSFNYFAGPLQKGILKTVDDAISKLQDMRASNFLAVSDSSGWLSFIREPISKLFMTIMKFFHGITGSWGIAIIFLTITLRLIIYPLHQRSIRSTKKLAELGPKLKALQEKHKNDPQTLRMEMALLYRNAGVNPLSSILPLLLQLPFFFGIFDTLRNSFDLRGASFIPGWIDNLSAPDTLFSWGFHIPIIGDGLHLLPLISCALMFLQQKMSAPASPSKKGDSGPMGSQMGLIMTVVFGVLFYTMPAGLNIYMIVSTGFALTQQYLTNKKQKKPLLPKKLRQ
jgi:YidC/Oxa1 family membrane protein insertase